MEKNTVKRRIFISNAMMVLFTLLIIFLINVLVIKGYSEIIEDEFKASIAQFVDADQVDHLLKSYTVRRNDFFLFFIVDGLLCSIILVVISQFFTKKLTKHIMTPLDALADGAKRIRDNELTQKIEYTGEMEFENVCSAFNEMQNSILNEQEKNKKYEKSRTDMIAGISHDLRTPLTAIRGSIKGLMDGVASSPEQEKKFLNIAYQRTGDMELLLKQLFYLSKMETGNMPIHLQKIEISSFLNHYVKSKQSFMDCEKEEIKLDTQDIKAELTIDPEQFQRVLDNLLENSCKYAEKSPLIIDITLKKTTESVIVRFKDNGVGVSEEKISHIFEEFYRGDESRNQKEGNGLGLYIVKYLMEAMGGHVKAESKEGLIIDLELPYGKEGTKDDKS